LQDSPVLPILPGRVLLFAEDQAKKISNTEEMAKRATTITVSRVRFFSMMVVPEKVLPMPPPREEDSPPPLPECKRIRPTRAALNIVCKNTST
jgi:hypothetical protein